MGDLSRIVVLLVVAVTLTVGIDGKSYAREIQISSQVPVQQVELLQYDLNQHFSFVQSNAPLEKLIGEPVTSAGLEKWLSDRMGYILEDSPAVNDNLSILNTNYQYENPDVTPDIGDTFNLLTLEQPVARQPAAQAEDRPELAESGGTVVASNVGTAIYVAGKQRKILVGYMFKSATNASILPITTPRMGLMMIGEGLFTIRINEKNPKSHADTVLRTSTLLHEARHSDGNGKSLGFAHALCPEGHPYFGQGYACDRNSNGPYNIEAEYLRQAHDDCVKNQSCTPEEAEGLALFADDAKSRIIDQRIVDARPEGH
jgi:hypothetical protein